MVVKYDLVHMSKYPGLADSNVPNLHLINATQSLACQSHVKEQFTVGHFYESFSNEGIQYFNNLFAQNCVHQHVHIMDVIRHFSKVGRNYFMMNKLTEKKFF